MPISLSAKKSLRKSLKNHKDNVSFKNRLKTIVKKFLAEPTNEGLKGVYSILDKAVKKNIFHKNKSDRLKSNYSKKVGGEGVKKVVAKKGTVKKVTKKVVKKTTKKTNKKM
ncbi:MAG: 30S ribosomal protein S20 [Candidatus Shapirobacteria bacterium]|nr:30S ribosomal protein S20 [Candidatus Shapirobacteria bacterium]MDD3002414.1 30S ribosomal protein S20 [Candidatus Shapirobacteria bacterium]MDD4383278.1 30S ribosomal protein S20 [Candidatus Shapirobacteria bacterium]